MTTPTPFRVLKAQINAYSLLTTKVLAAQESPRIPEYYARFYGIMSATAKTLKSNPSRVKVLAAREYWHDYFMDCFGQLPESSKLRADIQAELDRMDT